MRLQGGIGNQLFQWAYGRYVCERNGLPLVFEVSAYPDHAYGRVPVCERLWPEVPLVTGPFPRDTRVVRESAASWRPEGMPPWRMELPPGTRRLVFDGYWQDHRVVSPALVADLRNRLGAAVSPEVRTRAAALRKATEPSVAVHVRRHDYKNHGLANEHYYLDSLRWLQARVGALQILLFSDEPNYARFFFEDAGLAVEPVATGDDLGDLLVMASCTHQVIANSTFSWWGARLAAGRSVICPLPWSFAHTPSPALIPEHWRRVEGAVERIITGPSYTEALEAEQRRLDARGTAAQAAPNRETP